MKHGRHFKTKVNEHIRYKVNFLILMYEVYGLIRSSGAFCGALHVTQPPEHRWPLTQRT